MGTILQLQGYFGEGLTSHVITLPSPTTAGSAMAVLFHPLDLDFDADMVVSSVTGNNSETYSNNAASAGSSFGGSWLGRAYSAPNIAGRSGHQVTIATSDSSGMWAVAVEVAGVATAAPADGGMFAFDDAGGTQPSGSGVTPTTAGIHLAFVAGYNDLGGLNAWTPGTGWTDQYDDDDGGERSATLISRTAAGGVSQTASASGNILPDAWQIAHLVLKDAVAGDAHARLIGGDLLQSILMGPRLVN